MFSLLHNVLTKSLFVLLVAVLSVSWLPNHLFTDFSFEPKSLEPNKYDTVVPQPWNARLSENCEYIQLNNILGPESVAIAKNGLLYTGLADGRIVELDPSNKYKMRQVLRYQQSPKCKDNVATNADFCGRFLQLRFQNDTLYALESSTGLYNINIKAGTKTHLGPKPISPISLFNSFAFDSKQPNLVYITVSSTRWSLQRIVWSIFELESTGKILAMDTVTGKRVVVLDNLMMANGIDVDVKRDQLIFSESTSSQVNKLNLQDVRAAFKEAKDGAKLNSIQKFSLIPLVPGIPDNIVVDGDKAYIALPFVKLNGLELMDHLSTMPTVRMTYARLVYGIGKLLEYVNENLYRHPTLEVVYKELMSGHISYRLVQNDKSAVIEYNLATGSSELLGSNTFSFLSEALPDTKGNLFLGSFRSPFLVKVKLNSK